MNLGQSVISGTCSPETFIAFLAGMMFGAVFGFMAFAILSINSGEGE